MKLRRVNPSTIKVPEVRVTARFDPEMWELFQGSIKAMGAVAPIICCEVEGELVLVDGLHRLVEARNNGQTKIDVAVIEGDMVEVLTKNIFLDHLRGKTPVSEMVRVIEALWKEYKLDSEQIAAKTGLPRDYVEKLQLISELTPLCRKELDEGRIGVGHAFALTKLKDPVRQETVLQQQLLYRWTVRELEEYIKDVLAIVEKGAQAPLTEVSKQPITIKCFYCHGDFEVTQIANPNTCIECSGVMLASIAQAKRELEAEKRQQTE